MHEKKRHFILKEKLQCPGSRESGSCSRFVRPMRYIGEGALAGDKLVP